jgi:predicted outer membrane repeat protein
MNLPYAHSPFSPNKNASPRRRTRRSTRSATSPTRIESLESRLLFSAYTVTSLADDGSAGTLRAVVAQVNLDSSPDTITFASGLSGTMSLTSQIELSGADVSVAGPGASSITIDGGGATSLFRVDYGINVSFSGLTFANGFAGAGGAINSSGNTSVADCVFNNNNAPGVGGAIYSDGSLTVADSTFTNNTTGGEGGAVYVNSASADISGSTFSDNSATNGGNGGAVDDNSGSLTIENSTFAANSADGEGGALFETGGALTVTNATLSTNSAGASGGGLFVDAGSGNTTLYNTIVAGNLFAGSTTPSDIGGSLDQNLLPTMSPSSNNLIGTGGSGGLSNGVNANIVGVASAGLSALANNGGPTETMALLASSQAINAGNNALALDASGNALANDQRGAGFPRIINTTVDIGAFESTLIPINITLTPTLTVANDTATVDHRTTLTATLLDATNKPLAHKKITFMLNGVTVGTERTNAEGIATLCMHLTNINPGTYATGITATYAGDSVNPAVSGTGTLTVNDAPICGHDLDVALLNNKAVAIVEFQQNRAGAMASDFTVTIDWGDGSTPTQGVVTMGAGHVVRFHVESTYTYPPVTAKTTYTITTTIKSIYGATLTLTRKITIFPPPVPVVKKHK